MKKISLSLLAVIGIIVLAIPTVQGKKLENANDNIIASVSLDVKVGDYVFFKISGNYCSSNMRVSVYETNGTCGNYYALINGEAYKIHEGQWMTGTKGVYYTYSFVYDGCRYGITKL